MREKEFSPQTPGQEGAAIKIPNGDFPRLRVLLANKVLDIPLSQPTLEKMRRVLGKHGRELVVGGAVIAGATIAICYIRNKRNQVEARAPNKEAIRIPSPILSVTERGNFSEVYQRLYNNIRAFALNHTGNPQDAEDLTQQVFAQAIEAWPRFNPQVGSDRGARDPHKAWLFRIASNLLHNRARTRRRHPEVLVEKMFDIGTNDRDDLSEREFIAQEVLPRMEELSPSHQLLLVLKVFEELSNKEIAEILETTEGAIKACFSRTVRKLKELVHPEAA